MALEDRVLIAHSYSWHDSYGDQHGFTKLKVLPRNWFCDGQNPNTESAILRKIKIRCPTA